MVEGAILVVDVLSHPLPPLGVDPRRCNNGQVAEAEVGSIIATMIRHLAGQERHLPTAQAGGVNTALTVVQSSLLILQFKTKPYVRDVYLKFLLGGTAGVQDDNRSYSVRIDVGGTLTTTSTLNFTVLGGQTSQQVPWVSLLFTDVGPDPGKAENGGLDAEINITADSSFNTQLWSVDVVQLHTPLLDQ